MIDKSLCEKACTDLAVLEERVAGLVVVRNLQEVKMTGFEASLIKLNVKLDDLKLDVATSITNLRQSLNLEMNDIRKTSWQQFWILASIVVISSAGMVVYLTQQILGHVFKP
jgi:hypothetical protein